jgi:hypothetical protein
MNHLKVVATILCLALVALAFPPGMKADDQSKRTVVTFNGPVEIPGGKVLPAGTYVFKLMDSIADRNIVQIFSEDQSHVYATILAIPNYRFRATGKTVMTFGERSTGSPQAIRAWFYPGDNWGQEFVYPKARAIELAQQTNQPVLTMPTEVADYITAPVTSVNDPPVVALKQAPLKAVEPSGEEVPITKVVETPPTKRLPQTASPIPLLGLMGLLSLGASYALRGISKRAG